MLKAVYLNLTLTKDCALDDSERKELAKKITKHSLKDVFSSIRDKLCHNPDIDSIIEKLDAFILSFEKIDPESFAMRYPADSKLYASIYHKSIFGFDVQYTKEHFSIFWCLLKELYNKTEQLWACEL